jgi:hypothetical protein
VSTPRSAVLKGRHTRAIIGDPDPGYSSLWARL